MKWGRLIKLILLAILCLIVAAALIWAFRAKRQEVAGEQEGERPIKAPSRVSVQDGETVIALDRATQTKAGIEVTPLEFITHRKELRAFGTVLDIADLVDLRNSCTAAKAALEKAQANLAFSLKEYERLKKLHDDDRNVSDKVVQTAEAAWRSDDASLRAAMDAVQGVTLVARQRWGNVLAAGLAQPATALDRLFQGGDLLIQVTALTGEAVSVAPQSARIQTTGMKLVSAELLSQAPHTDPRIQGASFFYVAPEKDSGLLPGMNVVALLPMGPEERGVGVPEAALVRWQGRAWAYVQKDAEHFVRREIATDSPLENGWFLPIGFGAENRVVTRGAQLMLSEELRAEVQVGELGSSK